MISSASTVTVPDSILDRSRISLIRLSRSRAGAVNRARELNLLETQVVFDIVGQLLAENQNTVERRAQLVRHIGQKFGLVLGSQSQLGSLFFQRAPRLFDFLIFALDFDVLLGELLRLLTSCSLVCCNSVCRVCSSAANCCDCLSKPSVCIVASILFKTMPMLDVSCSRNVKCGAVKLTERRKIEDRLYLIFEKHR